MAVKIGHASGSENKTIKGKAGDQTGKELCTRTWYKHSKGWVTLRCKDPVMRKYIAEAMEKACANPDIGYDQYENQTLWNNVKDKGFDPSKTTKKVETDCARLVRVCCQYACEKVNNCKTIPDFYTASLASTLVKTGLFEKLTDVKYNTSSEYLTRGDIQVTKVKGHTWVILSDGSKVTASTTQTASKVTAFGDRTLKSGMKGEDVKELQKKLNSLNHDCGKVDGDFGKNTEKGVRSFQESNKLEVDGIVGKKTFAALKKVGSKVLITGNSLNVRPTNNTSEDSITTVHKNEKYDLIETKDGWYKIKTKSGEGWVSGKYSKVVEE